MIKRVLINGAGDKDAPTAVNILDAMDLLRDTAESDTVLLFIAGHGVNEEASYRFLPTDVERTGSSYRGRTVVSWQLLQEAIERAKGRRILFVDTCHSGNAYNQKLGNSAYHANIITYASARFDQEALEDAQLGHGLFTYAVVEGLEGKGAMTAEGDITTRGLAEIRAQARRSARQRDARRAGASILKGPRRGGLRAGEAVGGFVIWRAKRHEQFDQHGADLGIVHKGNRRRTSSSS